MPAIYPKHRFGRAVSLTRKSWREQTLQALNPCYSFDGRVTSHVWTTLECLRPFYAAKCTKANVTVESPANVSRTNRSDSLLKLVLNTASGSTWPRTETSGERPSSQQRTTLRRAGKQQQQRNVKDKRTPQANLQLT